MSEKIVIDLTKCLATVGTPIRFSQHFCLDSDLLPYPNAELKDVLLDVDVTFTNPDVEISGEVVCRICGSCDRCLAPVESVIRLPFLQIFYKDQAEDGYVYSASMLDATKAVEDEIVLSLPTLLLCSDDCKGLCPKCGANKNTTDCGCDTAKENVFSQLLNLKF